MRVKEIKDRKTTDFLHKASFGLLGAIEEYFPEWDTLKDEIHPKVMDQVQAMNKELIALEDLKLDFPLDFDQELSVQKAYSSFTGTFPGNFVLMHKFSDGNLVYLQMEIRFWYNPYNRSGATTYGVDALKVTKFKKV